MDDRKLNRNLIRSVNEKFEKVINGEIYHDGIINIDIYENASPRILWMLKEGTDVGDMSEIVNEKITKKISIGKTYQMIAWVTYGIIYDKEWRDIPYLSEETLGSVAIVNAKKIPGNSTSNDSDVLADYSKYKALIKEQIECYKPDIIIFGYPEKKAPYRTQLIDDVCKHFTGMEFSCQYQKNITSAFHHNEKLYIWVYHPELRYKNFDYMEMYLNEIVAISKEVKENCNLSWS